MALAEGSLANQATMRLEKDYEYSASARHRSGAFMGIFL